MEVRLDQIEQARPLREDERLVPVGDGLLERLEQSLDLRRRLRGLPRHERGVARRLAQAQERLERREDASPVGESVGDVLLGRDAHGVVDVALDLVELDVEHDVGPRRKLRDDLALRAPEDERPDLRAQARRGARVPGLDRSGVALLKVAGAAEQPRVREVHHAPQLLESVLDRRAAQRDAKLAAQLERGARGLAAEVLDGLRLVEDDDVPRLLREARRRRGAGRRRS